MTKWFCKLILVLILMLSTCNSILSAQEVPSKNDLNEIFFKIYQSNVSRFYSDGKFLEAVEEAEKSLKFARHSFEPGNPLIAAALTDLAWLYQAVGNNQKAGALHQEALEI